MSLNNLPVTRKLLLAFGILVTISIVSSALSIISMREAAEATRWNNHTHEVLGAANAVGAAMVDQETGVRGFLIAGSENFLEPYEAGTAAYDDAFERLKSLTSDNAEQQARIAALGVAALGWRDEVASVEISKMRNPATVDEARQMETSQAGKRYMDQIRSKLGEIRSAEEVLLEERSTAQLEDEARAQWTLIIGGGAGVLCALIMGVILSRAIASPLAALQHVMRRLAGGDHTVEVSGTGRKDEIGQMSGAVLTFKEAAIEKVRLEREAAEQRRLAEEERARNEAEKARLAEEDRVTVEALGSGLAAMAKGDLTHRFTAEVAPRAADLKANFNAAIEQLQDAVAVVATNVSAIRSGAGEISQAADDLSRRTEQQAASLEETAAALDEITATVNKTASGARQASETVQAAKGDAETSGNVVRDAVGAMGAIEKSSQEISQIIGVIDEIAFQTNLLALNAGVEAARAGDAGRGFAVVASEVRALAQRSAEAAKEIKTLISASSSQVNSGVALVGQTGEALQRIVDRVAEIDGLVSEIAASAQEQATGLAQVNTAVNQMDQVTQQNAAMVEESTAASHSLAQEAETLAGSVARFHIGAAAAPAHRAPAPVPAPRPSRTVTVLKTVGQGGAARKLEPVAAGDSWEEF